MSIHEEARVDRAFVFLDRHFHFAVPVLDVVEVIVVEDLRPGHVQLAAYLGNVRHRGRLLPLLDSVALTRGPQPSSADTPKPESAVVILNGDVRYALSLERFLTVIALEALPEQAQGPTIAAPIPAFAGCIAAVRAHRNNVLIQLATDALARGVGWCFGDQRILEATQVETHAAVVEQDLERFLCATLENLVFAIPIDQVIEVIEDYEVTPFFGVDPILRGLINLRGEVVSCVDISVSMGFRPRALLERDQYIVLEGAAGKLALCVDHIEKFRELPRGLKQEPAGILASNLTHFLSSVVEHDGKSIFILDVTRIFDSPLLAPYRRSEEP
jgi:purine-binding chemotaxis protein CheW